MSGAKKTDVIKVYPSTMGDVVLRLEYAAKSDTVALEVGEATKLYHELGRKLGIVQFPPAAAIVVEDMDPDDLKELRRQIQLTLLDPDYRLVTNVPMKVIPMGAVEPRVEPVPPKGNVVDLRNMWPSIPPEDEPW
jgi:hypothetical protein